MCILCLACFTYWVDTLTSTADIPKIRWLFILDDDLIMMIPLHSYIFGTQEYSETCLKRLFTGQTKVSNLDQ